MTGSHDPKACFFPTHITSTANAYHHGSCFSTAMIVVYVSVWPFIVFAWKEPSCADAGDGTRKTRLTRLHKTARARVYHKLIARERKRGRNARSCAEVDHRVEDLGHFHPLTKRLERSESEMWNEKESWERPQNNHLTQGLDANFEYNRGE